MARKKSRKRRVRKALKAKRSSKRSRSRRRNPGNFVKPTAAVAEKHLKQWEKQGVTSTGQITTGMKAPYVGTLENQKDVNLAKIRFAEAQKTVADFNQAKEAYKAKLAEWKEATKAGTKMPRPSAPSGKPTAEDAGRGGNFRPVSLARAKQYLEQVFRWNLAPKALAKNMKVDSEEAAIAWMLNLATRQPADWIKAKVKTGQIQQGQLGARVAEAVTVVGPAEAAKIYRRAQINAIKGAEKAAAAQAKKDAANKARYQKQLMKLKAEQEKLNKKLAALGPVAARAKARMKKARAKARMKKARAKARRRNPISRRKRGMRRARKSRAAKHGRRRVRRAKKAKKSKKARRRVRRAKKAKKSKKARRARKGRRSRRKR